MECAPYAGTRGWKEACRQPDCGGCSKCNGEKGRRRRTRRRRRRASMEEEEVDNAGDALVSRFEEDAVDAECDMECAPYAGTRGWKEACRQPDCGGCSKCNGEKGRRRRTRRRRRRASMEE